MILNHYHFDISVQSRLCQHGKATNTMHGYRKMVRYNANLLQLCLTLICFIASLVEPHGLWVNVIGTKICINIYQIDICLGRFLYMTMQYLPQKNVWYNDTIKTCLKESSYWILVNNIDLYRPYLVVQNQTWNENI